jgi:hypothetical protein
MLLANDEPCRFRLGPALFRESPPPPYLGSLRKISDSLPFPAGRYGVEHGPMSASNYGPVGADEGILIRFNEAVTARTILGAEATATNLSVVEHLIAPRETCGTAAPAQP